VEGGGGGGGGGGLDSRRGSVEEEKKTSLAGRIKGTKPLRHGTKDGKSSLKNSDKPGRNTDMRWGENGYVDLIHHVFLNFISGLTRGKEAGGKLLC